MSKVSGTAEAEERYEKWKALAVADPDLRPELEGMTDAEKNDAFYRGLEFGTAGLRGVIGAGTNRMNVYVIARATQGLADYVKSRRAKNAGRGAVICYDSRRKSRLFAETAASVFAGNGIPTAIFPSLAPVPCLSFAVRRLGCAAGVMITASHNPAEYNGYKVFGPDGCQITSAAAEKITASIEKYDYFSKIRFKPFDEGVADGSIVYTEPSLMNEYLDAVRSRSVLPAGDGTDRSIQIVYSPLHGAGLVPVTEILKRSGFTGVSVVPEHAQPDGNFPGCPFPNPELPETLQTCIKYAEKTGAGMTFATDPDCDRIGAAVKDGKGEWKVLSGNQTGTLLLDFICARLSERGAMPKDPVCVKTIVTADICEKIAASYGVGCVSLLTGFKYIGEYIGRLEKKGRADSFIFGFEESCGYLSGSYVRDKDGVVAAMLFCEMYAYYASRGILLTEKLDEIYSRFGYALNKGNSYYFKGAAGFGKMAEIMKKLRAVPESIGGLRVTGMKDYSGGIDGLPPSDVIRYSLEGDCSVIIRPSGTEPKLKAYFSVTAKDEKRAGKIMRSLENAVAAYMK